MSAESPRRGLGDGVGNRNNGNIMASAATTVFPQPVTDRSIIDSVTGFINEVALTSSPQLDPKEQIIWMRFETDADISDLAYGEDWDLKDGCAPPLILTLGYSTGIQMWAIPGTGEAVEILSWRHGGPIQCLKILPTPLLDSAADQAERITDVYSHKRTLMAIAEQNIIAKFISLRDGDMVKCIEFKHPIVDILANRTAIVITFQDRIAVFDARNFDERCTVTTCYPSPGLIPNPVALGARWLAYSELRLLPTKRSNGGCDGLTSMSTISSVISVAKTLGKGLKGIGETIGLTSPSTSQQQHHHQQPNAAVNGVGGISPNGNSSSMANGDGRQPGIVTVIDINHTIKTTSPTTGTPVTVKGADPIVVHFLAHSDPIVNLKFDPSGMLLLTADKRGHDFNVFRIYPHPCGPSMAAVHHLYVLHRGDTTAKVQDMNFTTDSRWVSVSSLRGTTHVFPITPYGGPIGKRTHGSSYVVNQMSRFHRSAGLSLDGRSCSPVANADANSMGGGGGNGSGSLGLHHNKHNGHSNGTKCYYKLSTNAHPNPRNPPFPQPTVIQPLAQIRQPYLLANGTGASTGQSPQVKDYFWNVTGMARPRNSSLSDDSSGSSRICATFARPRVWLLKNSKEPQAGLLDNAIVESLFVMASHGALVQYDLKPRIDPGIPSERVGDDTPLELLVEPKAQWNLLRSTAQFNEIEPPLPSDNYLLRNRFFNAHKIMASGDGHDDDRWLSQVEIITYTGPDRRLWMGPQILFKTFIMSPTGDEQPSHYMDSVEVDLTAGMDSMPPVRSNPMNMPIRSANIPVHIESGSFSSYEQSPRLLNNFRTYEGLNDFGLEPRDSKLREDLADAMKDAGDSKDSTDQVDNCAGDVSKVSIKRVNSLAEEQMSSSSFSSSRASFDAHSSPTASYSGDHNLLHFHGDSSGSL